MPSYRPTLVHGNRSFHPRHSGSCSICVFTEIQCSLCQWRRCPCSGIEWPCTAAVSRGHSRDQYNIMCGLTRRKWLELSYLYPENHPKYHILTNPATWLNSMACCRHQSFEVTLSVDQIDKVSFIISRFRWRLQWLIEWEQLGPVLFTCCIVKQLVTDTHKLWGNVFYSGCFMWRWNTIFCATCVWVTN